MTAFKATAGVVIGLAALARLPPAMAGVKEVIDCDYPVKINLAKEVSGNYDEFYQTRLCCLGSLSYLYCISFGLLGLGR